MATSFTVRTASKSGRATIIARVQRPEIKLDLRLSTNLQIDADRWNSAKGNKRTSKNLRNAEETTFRKLDEIEKALDSASKNGLSSKDARLIIDSIVYREVREAEQKALEEKKAAIKAQEEAAQSNNFIDFYRSFVDDAKAGRAKCIGRGKGGTLGKRTVINYAQGLTWLEEYQQEELSGRGISFADIDQKFFNDYQTYLEARSLKRGQFKGETGCSHNTVCMRLAELKSMLKRAEKAGQPVRKDYTAIETIEDKDVDSIALTRTELDAIMAVDLSDLPKCYEEARDIFMVGVWTAQRVSDYNGNKPGEGIKPEDIKTQENWTVVEEDGKKVAKKVEVTFISFRQKKTKAIVNVPANSALKAILEKYHNQLPFIWEQKLNDYMKTIARRAGITQKERVTRVRGGKEIETYMDRCDLIHSHTARKTACTLMYNEGIDLYDIMKVSGHTSLDTLKKYIKCTGGESAFRIYAKYDYFK